MTIEAINIKNFQGHEDSTIEFEKLNVIEGTSGNGKSSIIRAIKKCLSNKPASDFLSDFADEKDECSSTVQFSEGEFITWKRIKNKSSYILSTEKSPLEAFGKGLPDSIPALSKMDERNIKSQHDPYFMFQSSPGEVARRLNEAAGNVDINIFFKKIDSIIDHATRQSNFLQTQIKEKEEEVNKLQWIDKALEDINALIAKMETKSKLESKIKSLTTLKTNIAKLSEEKDQIEEWLKIEEKFLALWSKVEKFSSITDKLKKITNLRENIVKGQEKISNITEWLSVEKRLDGLMFKIKAYNEKQRLISDVSALQNQAVSLSKRESQQKLKVEATENTFSKKMKEVGVCPLCGSSTQSF